MKSYKCDNCKKTCRQWALGMPWQKDFCSIRCMKKYYEKQSKSDNKQEEATKEVSQI